MQQQLGQYCYYYHDYQQIWVVTTITPKVIQYYPDDPFELGQYCYTIQYPDDTQ